MLTEEHQDDYLLLGRRIVIMVIFLASLGMCGFQTYGLFLMYFDDPVETQIKVTLNDVMEFPAVTVCNLNPVRRSRWKKGSNNQTTEKKEPKAEKTTSHIRSKRMQGTAEPKKRSTNVYHDIMNADRRQLKPIHDKSTIKHTRIKRWGVFNEVGALKKTVQENTKMIASLNRTLGELLAQNETSGNATLEHIFGNISSLWSSLNGSLLTLEELDVTTEDLSKRLRVAELTTSEIVEEMMNTKSYLNYLRTNMSKMVETGAPKNETSTTTTVEGEKKRKELPPSKDMEAFNDYLKDIGTLTENDIHKLGHQKEDFIAICSWKGSICDSSHFQEFQNFMYGNCFTFNTSLVGATVRGTGPRNGLTLSLFIEQNEYIDRVAPAAGARIVIHEHNYKPFPEEEGFSVAPGYTTAVFLRKSTTETVKPMCNPDIATSYVQNGTETLYSRKACYKQCLSDAILRDCRCSSTELLLGTNTCSKDNQEQAQCVERLENLAQNNQLPCSCAAPCRTTTYLPMISSAIWPAEKYLPSLLEELVRVDHKVLDAFENITDFAQYFREHFLRIDIFFQELSEQEVIQRHSYGIKNLLSDIGGQLGLWIGVSVATLTDSIESIGLLAAPIIERFCRVRRLRTHRFHQK